MDEQQIYLSGKEMDMMIAEKIMGWRYKEEFDLFEGDMHERGRKEWTPSCDANDMCEVEDKISQDAELRARYTKALMYIVNSEKPSRYDDIFRVLSANASDRCRAALAAVKAY